MTSPLRFGSVCSGIEAASVAWLPLGWKGQFMSEIEAFPRAVLQHHYPEVPLHGDFTTIQAGQYEPIDALVGGTPCQSFSVAGLRGGMADARGNLALEYLRLADRLRPRWLVWENVPGVRSSNAGRDFGAFLGGLGELGYGWAYRSLDAQYFGLAQRRERVFVVGCVGDWRRAAAVLFDPASLRGDPAPGRKAGAGAAVGTLGGTSPGGGWRIGCDEAAAGQLIAHSLRAQHNPSHRADSDTYIPVASALRSRDGARGVDSDCTDTLVCAIQDGTGGGTPLVAGTLRTHGDAHSGFEFADGLIPQTAAVRRLTPGECERLQGFPDGYTDVPYRGKQAADGSRYKALGNSFAVPVMAWIGRRITEQAAA